MSNIEYSIDKVIKKRDRVFIRGWAYKEGADKVQVSLKDIPEKYVSSYKVGRRLDLYNKFKSEEAALSGFHLSTDYKDKITVELRAGDEKVNLPLNIKKISSLKGDSKMDRLNRLLNVVSIKKGLKELKENGISYTYNRVKDKIVKGNTAEEITFYNKWFLENSPSEEELERQRNHVFEYRPKFSVIIPTYNTKREFLCDVIESVRMQTYSNWELCIADGASTSEETLETLREYEKIDNRIKVSYLKENYMISGNTNEALKLVEGDYVALLDHDDLLTVDCLYEYAKVINEDRDNEFIYCDEDKTDELELEYYDPHFKQDWAPDTLRSYNYITHFSVFSKKLMDEIGVFNSKFDGSQDYDMILRLTEKAKKVAHIPKILYHWRVHSESTAGGIGAKPYCITAAKGALKAHIDRLGQPGTVTDGKFSASYKINYDIIGEPKVSVLIPNKDHIDLLKKCINSVLKKTTYKNYEIIVIENNSEEEETFKYYEELKKKDNIKVVKYEGGFNYSAINNFGAKEAEGEYLLLLNNDTEVINGEWMTEMLMHAQRKDVAVVGAKLYYPDDTIQHCGVILGVGGIADHLGRGFKKHDNGHMGRLSIVQNLSAVTGACLMISKEIYNEVHGLNEELAVAYNDVDLCMKVREKGYLVVFTPYAELYHYESKSRGQEDTEEKKERFNKEVELFKARWGENLVDPYYNINFKNKNAKFLFNEEEEEKNRG